MSGLPPQSLPAAYRPRSSVRCSRWSCPSEPCWACSDSSCSWPRFEPGPWAPRHAGSSACAARRGAVWWVPLLRLDRGLGLARHHRVVPERNVDDRLARTFGLLLLFDLAPLFVSSFSHGPQFL